MGLADGRSAFFGITSKESKIQLIAMLVKLILNLKESYVN